MRVEPQSETSPRVLLFDPWSLVPYYTIALAQGLKAAGIQVTVGSITYDLDPGCFRRAGIRNDPGILDLISHHRIAVPALRRLCKLAQGIVNLVGWLFRLLVDHSLDIIHVQQLRLVHSRFPIELWFLRLARNLDYRIVCTVHNLLPHDTGNSHYKPYLRLYQYADALICHSEATKAQLESDFAVEASKIHIIPHGLLFAPDPHLTRHGRKAGSERMVLFQGFLRPYKGIEFLLDAWRHLNTADGSTRLIIAGTGDSEYISHLESMIETYGIKRSVTFLPTFLPPIDIAQLYESADVVVYPYREITTSGALMTAIANNKAIVATDLPLFRATLQHNHNALLVPYGDEATFAATLRLLLSDADLRARLGRNVSDLSRHFSWTSIGQKTRESYETVLGRLRLEI